MEKPKADVKVLTHVYKNVAGVALTIDVHTPAGFDVNTGTCLLHYHGGFLVIGKKAVWPPNWLIKACHHRGWAYCTPSYRLLPEVTGLDVLQDAVDAALWASEHVAKRLILAGSSAGGYLALATVASPQCPPVVALLSIYGVLDPASERHVKPGEPLMVPIENLDSAVDEIWAATVDGIAIDEYELDEDNFMADKRQRWFRAMHEAALFPDVMTGIKGLSHQILTSGVSAIPEKFRGLFPVSFGLNPKFPPTALLHGDADTLVGVDQSTRVAGLLKGMEVKVLLEVVSGGGHGFDVGDDPAGIDIDVEDKKASAGLSFSQNLVRFIGFLDDSSRAV